MLLAVPLDESLALPTVALHEAGSLGGDTLPRSATHQAGLGHLGSQPERALARRATSYLVEEGLRSTLKQLHSVGVQRSRWRICRR